MPCPPSELWFSLRGGGQGVDAGVNGGGEQAESSRYSRSYTSGATLGTELRRGRSRRLSSSLQVPALTHPGNHTDYLPTLLTTLTTRPTNHTDYPP